MSEAERAGKVVELGKVRRRVLVVDDEADIRLMLSLFFCNAGHDVVTKPSAAEALRAAQDERFDVVVSDIGMPSMDGYELARALREVPGYEAVPLIAVSGFVEYSDREFALRAGFNERMSKPINLPALLELVTRLGGEG
ncbi:MAG: response regulator [Acidobacteria bacterium]|nr:response regulator [Acidobacteriota bacterium]MCA1642594.1 response regulator [Acidobacteriota bacterium]